MAASVASRYALGADGVGAARPGARGSRVTASRYALGAEGGGAASALRARAPTCALHVMRTLSPGGEWGCQRRRALRAAREARCKACFELLPRARVGWHTARTSVPPPPPRSSGAPVRWFMARGRRARGVAAAPRSHAAGAPAARRRRAMGGACAFKRPAKNLVVVGGWWWWCAHQLRITSGWLPLFGGSIQTVRLLAL